jgi:RNA polymerase sigma factor (sigma-70 family)
MDEHERDTLHTSYIPSLVEDGKMTISHAALIADMEQVFTEARPRLLRLAQLNGMSPDVTDDVVQETMLEAWRHIEQLRDPQRFDAWLDGICRNVCRRYQTQEGTRHRHESLSHLADDQETSDASGASLTLADPYAIDPAEELSRQDLATLLDRAMEHLAPDSRKLLELCYLANIPQREAALQLGVTIGALELRLHRARRQLRQVLNGALHTDAESFGLALDPLQVKGWRDTRQWCWLCGKHRMIGLFETLPTGQVGMRLHCSGCFDRYGFDVVTSGGLVSMEGLSSFRPAIKRLYQQIGERFWGPLTKGTCFMCHGPAQISIIGSSEVSFPVPPDRYWVYAVCPKCGESTTDIGTVFLSYPPVYQFLLQHDRCITEPPQFLEHEGRLVICARLTDITSADQLALLLDARTLQLLVAF